MLRERRMRRSLTSRQPQQIPTLREIPDYSEFRRWRKTKHCMTALAPRVGSSYRLERRYDQALRGREYGRVGAPEVA